MDGQEEYDQELADALDDWGSDNDEDQYQGDNMEKEDTQEPAAKRLRVGDDDLHPSGPALEQEATQPSDTVEPLVSVLPTALVLRIFAFLSADDLISLAKTCSLCAQLASEDVLWRRLYCARWGKPASQSVGQGWKARYMSQDGEEVSAALSGVSDDVRGWYLDMHRARRQQCLGRGAIDDMMEVPRCQVQEQLAAWRTARGFPPHTQPPRPAFTQDDAQLRFTRVTGDVYTCTHTGWMHKCDHTCREGVVDPDSDLLVCPISGRSSDRMMTEHEVRSMRRARSGPRGHDEGDGAYDFAGAMARAYMAGYSCSNERELRRRCGVSMR